MTCRCSHLGALVPASSVPRDRNGTSERSSGAGGDDQLTVLVHPMGPWRLLR